MNPQQALKRLKYAHFPYLRESLVLLRRDLGREIEILDMGCGPGNMGAFCGNGKDFSWVGVDLWIHQLDQAREKRIYHGLAQANLVHDLPFMTGSFDALVCNEVLMYLPDVDRALSEAHRVLKTNGKAFIYNPISLAPNAVWSMKRVGRFFHKSPDAITFDTDTDWKSANRPGRISYFSLEGLKQRVEEAGFKVDQVKAFRLFRNRLRLLKRLEDLEAYRSAVMGIADRFPHLACDVMVAATK